MALALGIHCGHHASCALVCDGRLVAAIEQERITRRKGDGTSGLSQRLPIEACLRQAGRRLAEVDLIVSSFQAIGPGGAGLTQPLVEPGFRLFDPLDPRHMVVSHHYAHALSTLGTSGFAECGILICDLAGSTTENGKDFFLAFPAFLASTTGLNVRKRTKTECMSMYKAFGDQLTLLRREYCVPHSAPEVFVYSPASLYDNMSRMVFGKENAHGELMAIATMAPETSVPGFHVNDVVCISNSRGVQFKNGWQHRIQRLGKQLEFAPYAAVIQQAFEKALLHYAEETRNLTACDRLAVAGGVFLNITSNSAIVSSGLFREVFVPSAPHDAGIAVGCAFHGSQVIAQRHKQPIILRLEKSSDRVGSAYADAEVMGALESRASLAVCQKIVTPADVSILLNEGQILARFAGRAEFGPRALGGRSLLASPLLADSKARLNEIKGRQSWRPVAPIVLRDRIAEFFAGPEDSPYMNMAHRIHKHHRIHLAALAHPDGSARVQTLTTADDPFLYQIVEEFGLLTGYPIVVNTSLNGKDEPLIETPLQAIDFFLAHSSIDALLLEERLIRRATNPDWSQTRLAPEVLVSKLTIRGVRRSILVRGALAIEMSEVGMQVIERLPLENVQPHSLSPEVQAELTRALFGRFLVSIATAC